MGLLEFGFTKSLFFYLHALLKSMFYPNQAQPSPQDAGNAAEKQVIFEVPENGGSHQQQFHRNGDEESHKEDIEDLPLPDGGQVPVFAAQGPENMDGVRLGLDIPDAAAPEKGYGASQKGQEQAAEEQGIQGKTFSGASQRLRYVGQLVIPVFAQNCPYFRLQDLVG